MKKNISVLLSIFLFTSILLSNNVENLKPKGILSVQKFLESKQIEYKNSVKNNESVNIEEYKILIEKLSQIKSYKSKDQVHQKVLLKQSKINKDNILRKKIIQRLIITNNYRDDGSGSDCDTIGGNESWIGDGWCDEINNNETCGFDNGDCCYSTCVSNTYDCDANSGPCTVDICIDPNGNNDGCEDSGDDGGSDDGGEDCEFFDCVGTPACGYEEWLGDDICDDGTWGIVYDCEEFNFDEGDCEGEGDGGGDDGSVDDGGTGGDDGGDDGEDCDFFDCVGTPACGYEDWIADGICDDGTQWGIDYNCEEFNFDEGDCDDVSDDGGDDGDGGWDDGGAEECEEDYVDDCSGDGDCCPESWISDGFADCEDQPWGCDLTCYDNDGGDCDESSDGGGDDGSTDDGGTGGDDGGGDGEDCEFFDCVGTPACGYEDWIADGICDDGTQWGIDYNCEEFNFDEGDCEEGGDDGSQEGCWEDGEFYCYGCELWYSDCEYYECTQDGWSGPFVNDECNDDGGDDGGDSLVYLIIGDTNGSTDGDMPGEGIQYGATVPLFYESSVPIGGIQFTVTDSPNWLTGIELSSNVGECFEVNSNDVEGSLIGIMFSLTGCELETSESLVHFADISYTISADAEWGSEVELYFSDAIVADGEGNSLSVSTEGGSVSVSLPGDVNSDSEINVMDVVNLINFVLFFDEPTEYQFWASDVNGDNALNVLDVVLLVDLILDINP